MIIHIEYTCIWYDHTYWIHMNMTLSCISNIHEYDIARRMSPSRSAIIHIEYTWIWYDHTYWIHMNMIWSYILNIYEYEMIIHIEYRWTWYCPSDVTIAQRDHTYWIYMDTIWSYILNIHAYDMIIHIEYTWIRYDHTYWIYMNMILPVGCRHRAAQAALFRTQVMRKVPYLCRSFFAKEPCTYWLFCRKRPATSGILFEPKSYTDLDLTLLHILILRTCSRFAWENQMLALAFYF